MALLAFLLCAVGVAGLFFLDRDRTARNSKMLWVPVLWMWIVGSRTPSMWLGVGSDGSGQGLDSTLEGNSTDAAVFTALVALGALVLLYRKRRTRALLGASVPVLLYFAFCLLSALWSPFPDVVLKRWIKAAGDLVMVLVILTDSQPIQAIRRLFSRVGFILLPLSIVLIRYTSLGRGFDPDGEPMNTGVTTNKNTLGLITFVLALGAVWNLISLLQGGKQPDRGRRLLAQGTLVAIGLVVLGMAHSATSIACFVLGAGLMVLTSSPAVRRRPFRMHAVVLTIALAAGVGMVFDLDEVVVHALGRNSNLTGRAEIWQTVIPMAENPIIGTGFQSFWNSAHHTLAEHSGGYMFANLSSAHNGYIETYLNLGWIGVGLILLILVNGYRRAGAAFGRDPQAGTLILAYVVAAAIYSITEAGFRMLTPTWISVLLAVTLAGGIARGQISPQVPASAIWRRPRNGNLAADQPLIAAANDRGLRTAEPWI